MPPLPPRPPPSAERVLPAKGGVVDGLLSSSWSKLLLRVFLSRFRFLFALLVLPVELPLIPMMSLFDCLWCARWNVTACELLYA